MDNDPQTTTDCKEQPDEERQDRRQFFNGFGKWSLAIIAAVSSLTGYGARAQASRSDPPKPEPEPQRPAWGVPEDRGPGARLAGTFKPRPYLKNHDNYHLDYSKHTDQKLM